MRLLLHPLMACCAMLPFKAGGGEVSFDFESDPYEELEFTSTQAEVWSKFLAVEGTGNDGEFLVLTEATGSQRTTIVFEDIDDGKLVKAFNLKMDIRTGNGTTGRPADGFSISFARAGDPLLEDPYDNFSGFPPETGAPTGIAVTFDTWAGNTMRGGVADYEGVYVHVDGVPVGGVRMNTRHGECDDPDSLQTGPRTQNSPEDQDKYGIGEWGGNPDSLCWQPFELNLDPDGVLNVTYKGNPILEDFQTAFFPSAGQVVLAGRTGGANELKHIDNLRLTTVLADRALVSGFTSAADSFSISLRDINDSVVDDSDVALSLNGEPVTPSSVSKNGEVTTATYDSDVLWPSGSEQTIGVSARLQDGSRLEREFTFTVPTYVLIGKDLKLEGPFTERGFLMRVKQPQDGIGLPNNTNQRERHLADLLVDAEGDVYQNVVDYGGSGYTSDEFGFVKVDDFVNFSIDNAQGAATDNGVFRTGGTGGIESTDVADKEIPGIPGDRAEGQTDAITAEILAVVEVPAAGMYRFAFNSDDGFKTTAGVNTTDALDSIYLGGFNGGRGAATTFYNVAFEEPGFYRIRNIWYEGGGGANLEWWLAEADGTPIALFNDDANGGLKLYRDNISPDQGSVIVALPNPDATGQRPDPNIQVVINSEDSLDLNSVSVTVDGVSTDATVSRQGKNSTINATAPDGTPGSIRTVVLEYGLDGQAITRAWQFTTDDNVLDCAFATVPGSGTTSGFNYFTHQGGGNIVNLLVAENRLESDAPNGADPARGTIDGVINFQQEANSTQGYFNAGNGYQDDFLPGIGIDGDKNHIATEFTAYLEFTEAGYYRMGVASDDGFKVSNKMAGDRGDPEEAAADALGHYWGGRGTGETSFGFFVPVAGVYPMRLVWFEGEGGADLEWYSINSNGTRSLINDPDDDNAIMAYRERNETMVNCPSGLGVISVSFKEDGGAEISFEGSLLSSGTVEGPYTEITGVTSPYTIPGNTEQMFYISR